MSETSKTMPTSKADGKKAIEVNDGQLAYASGAAEGRVEIEVPGLAGSPNAVERLHVADFGPFVVGKLEASMNRQGYLRSGPQQRPSAVFRHYTGTVKGYGLMDGGAIARMEELAREFEEEPDQREYFEQVLRPYLLSLTPKKR
ncbi:MAG TPA: hypothetical protein VMW54_11905 [Terriglobia bacterium]|nr:hypothetical protein [Terriglobia bacterium]